MVEVDHRTSGAVRWAVFLSLLVFILPAAQALSITATKTEDPPGLLSVDGCGSFCNVGLSGVTFTAADFPVGSVITDVDVSIAWFKTDGSCTTPLSGNAFHSETNFRIDLAGGSTVVLAQPGTWTATTPTGPITTGFDQSAGAIPSGTPASGTFLPNNGNLDTFDGASALGTFTLRPGDTGSGDPLCVDSYSVTVTADAPPIVINEVDADTAGTDTLEFVELYDGGIGNVSLTGLVLVFFNGASDDSYFARDLDGQTTDANGYFVLGNAAVANVSDVFADNTLQNGADAVALYVGDATDFPSMTALTTTNLLDALVYDTSDADDAGLLALMLPGQPQIDENGNGNKDFESNQRCPDGGGGQRVSSAYIQETPTPGATNFCVVPADLSITKTDGQTTATPGGTATYTITASNAGPSAAAGSTVSDTFPAACTSVSWTCVGAGGGTCTVSGSGDLGDTVNLPVSGSVTYTATCSIDAAATGSLANTATVAVGGAVIDPNLANNSATDTDTLAPSADLSITKTDGQTSATPGGSATYTITASNAGPSDAPGSSVSDTFPAACTSVSWTCVGAGGGSCTASGSGNLGDTVSLPVGGSVTYTATCNISAAATGSLVNTATVAAGGGATDPNPANNSATDTDTLALFADLSITKTDGLTTVTPGGTTTYTITASNAGPSAAPGSTVSDSFPAACTSVSWTCAGAGGGTCTASGSGNLGDVVNLPVSGSVTYTATCSVDAAATGSLVNTATVSVAGGVTDPNPANNSATDTDTLAPSADLSITKTDGQTSATPGGTTTYTITASNAGPSAAPGSTVTDSFPAACTSVSWTCVGAGGGSCTASGSGNLGDTVSLPVSGSVTYTATCSIDSAATGSLANTATVAVGGGVSDPNAANNSATDTDTLAASGDLSITKTDGVATVEAGDTLTYTIVASNAGPSDATGVGVSDSFPSGLTCSWTCAGSGGGSCAASGSGNIADSTVALPAAASVTYTATCDVDLGLGGGVVLSNTASLTVPGGFADGNGANDSATDTTTTTSSLLISATKTVTTPPEGFTHGATVAYTIVLSNAGPGTQADNAGDEFVDILPAGIDFVSASATSGAATYAPATRTLSWNGPIAAGTSVTITLTATINGSARVVSNQGIVNFDGDVDGVNESSLVTDNPASPGSADATAFQLVVRVPANSTWALVLLALLSLLVVAPHLRRMSA